MNNPPRIVFLDRATLGTVDTLAQLHQLGHYVEYDYTTPEQLGARIANAEIVITNKVTLRAADLAAATQLQLVCVAATGTNVVDTAYCAQHGIGVRNAVDYATHSVAQFTYAILLALLHRIPTLVAHVYSGAYAKDGHFSYWDHDFWQLQGRRLGIIGLGHIGQRVAEIGQAFGMHIAYYSTTGEHDHPTYPRLTLAALLHSCDVISIHAPLNERTQGLINYELMQHCQPTAVLVNVGRGGIVDEADLVRALDDGLLAGAAVDVFTTEPLPTDHVYFRVQDRRRLLLTPHAAWAAVEARTTLVAQLVTHIRRFIEETDPKST